MAQAAREISVLRESQAQAVRYRHDLRHHLQYLLFCLENSQTERAKDYISCICAEIEAQKVRRWCENEAANLILSSFDERAGKMGIRLDIQGAIPAVLHVSDSDLCVVLSNALKTPSMPASCRGGTTLHHRGGVPVSGTDWQVFFAGRQSMPGRSSV